jgi:hypothetical protein
VIHANNMSIKATNDKTTSLVSISVQDNIQYFHEKKSIGIHK